MLALVAVSLPFRRFRSVVPLAVALGVLAATMPIMALSQEVPELQITSTNYIADRRRNWRNLRPARRPRAARAGQSDQDVYGHRDDRVRTAGRAIITSEADLVSEFASQVGFARAKRSPSKSCSTA